MGMYDTICGEQVKCFPWVSFYKNEISYHGGSLKYYGIGDEVPYKTPHYNYTKNFIILDLNRFPDFNEDYDFILHVIVDGKVQNTFTDKIGEIDWTVNNLVVDYWGGLLNIHSSEDVLEYIRAQRNYWEEYEMINANWNNLFKESSKYFNGLALLDKDSEEKKMRHAKLKELHELMDKEKERIKPEIEALSEKLNKWIIDTSDIDDLINLGDYISAYYTDISIEGKNHETCKDMVKRLLDTDPTLYDRYVKWQGTDEDIKKFI